MAFIAPINSSFFPETGWYRETLITAACSSITKVYAGSRRGVPSLTSGDCSSVRGHVKVRTCGQQKSAPSSDLTRAGVPRDGHIGWRLSSTHARPKDPTIEDDEGQVEHHRRLPTARELPCRGPAVRNHGQDRQTGGRAPSSWGALAPTAAAATQEHRPGAWGHRGEGAGHRRAHLGQAAAAVGPGSWLPGLHAQSAADSSPGEERLAA